jgi:hypothetical protein
VHQGSVLSPILYSLYINDVPSAPGTNLALFADDTCIYGTQKHERHVICKLQRGLTAVNSLCARWNIKFNEGKTHAIYFCRRLRVPDNVLQLNRWDIPFANYATYLGVTFDRRMSRRHRIERTDAKALRTYVRTYSLFKSGCTNTELALYKALIRPVMTYACPTWEYAADALFLKLQRLRNRALRAIGNLDRWTPVRKLHVVSKIQRVFDCINYAGHRQK